MYSTRYKLSASCVVTNHVFNSKILCSSSLHAMYGGSLIVAAQIAIDLAERYRLNIRYLP